MVNRFGKKHQWFYLFAFHLQPPYGCLFKKLCLWYSLNIKIYSRSSSYRRRVRMKKVLLAVLLLAMVLLPATAAERASKTDLAVGLNLGTNSGVGVQYRMNDFDVIGNVGFGFLGGNNLSVDAAANYKVTEFYIENAQFDVTVGGGAALSIPFEDDKELGLAAIVPVGIVYNLDSMDFPLDFYLRVAPGIRILPEVEAYLGGYIGALWRF